MNRTWKIQFRQLFFCERSICIRRGFAFTSRHHKVNIAYSIYPEGSTLNVANKPPIFVLHGVYGSKSNWHSLAKRMADDTHRQIITLDARNHGDSDHHPEMNYLNMRDDLLGVMDKLKIEKPVLLGHSMGGKTVMTCALSTPERVDSLIVVDTAPKDSPGTDTIRQYALHMRRCTLPSSSLSAPEARRIVNEELQKHVPEPGVRQFLLTNLVAGENGTYKWRVNLEAIDQNFDHLHSFPHFSQPCTTIPTVFIGGGKSKHVDEEAVPAMKKFFPKAPLQLIPYAGHWVHAERPAQFVQLVQQFVLAL